MAKSDRTNILRFFGNLIARLRKWLIKVGSPFRLSRRFVRDLQPSSRRRQNQSGFVLPTVAMVSVLTTLLVVTIVSRSSELAQTAANARVEQTFRSVNTPIIDRARAKLAALLADSRLPRTTPSNTVLDTVLQDAAYTYPDETRLQINQDFLGNGNGIETATTDINQREFINTAWKFPIDTDGNGKFDAFGLYSLIFRVRPNNAVTNLPDRPVSLLEARSLPMDEGIITNGCVGAGANVATTEGWIDSVGKLRKAFFIYATTVPISPTNTGDSIGTILSTIKPAGDTNSPAGLRASDAANYELFTGRATFSALELQQDRERNPLNNNAVWFENDLELTNTPVFRLNGRVYTSGSLMVGANNSIVFYQVSASNNDANSANGTEPGSCYYRIENGKIIVAGNVVMGDALTADPNQFNNNLVNFDLFLRDNANPAVGTGGRQTLVPSLTTVTDSGRDVLANDLEYNRRIEILVRNAIARGTGTVTLPANGGRPNAVNVTYPDPESVKAFTAATIFDEGLTQSSDFENARRRALQVYFRQRTRRVPTREVTFTQAFNNLSCDSDTNPANGIDLRCSVGEGNLTVATIDSKLELLPPMTWMAPSYGNTGNFTRDLTSAQAELDGIPINAPPASSLTLRVAPPNNNQARLPASDPLSISADGERLLGDRIQVGNNLPARWLRRVGGTNTIFANNRPENENNRARLSTNDTVFWDNPDGTAGSVPRYRVSQADTLDALGETTRNGFWEISAASNPADPLDPNSSRNSVNAAVPAYGGLRVVTNAGIYSSLNFPATTTPDALGTFLERYHTSLSDSPATPDIDESSAPKDNPNTPFNEARFAGVPPVPTATATEVEKDQARARVNFVVWPDSMPMTGNRTEFRKGDLQMRATAVYHYKTSAFDPANPETYQTPIACVSSYYDPSYSYASNPFLALSATNQLISSAVNRDGLPWDNRPANITDATFVNRTAGRSNDGIVYAVGRTASNVPAMTSRYSPTTGLFSVINGAENPANTSVSLGDRLAYQANLIFPNGRFANEPLRGALQKVSSNSGNFATARLTIAEQATVDSNLCALQIADGSISPPATPVFPHGAISESAFLDGREVKSLNRNEYMFNYTVQDGVTPRIATNRESRIRVTAENGADVYDLQLEQRQPIEVRVTDLNLDLMRTQTITGNINPRLATDFILPYSGIIYATREDALTDASSATSDLSATDFVLDPTRRPSAIRLVNGYRLWRADGLNVTAQPAWTEATRGEKGLILATNLPAYVRAQARPSTEANTLPVSGFNVHTREEFTNRLITSPPASVWSNFYTRTAAERDANFACRPGQFATCNLGDNWRAATVIADSISVQSATFRDGYRNDGDFDLRNNADTSTSTRWNDRRNPDNEKIKDSSYVQEHYVQGFFNNNFVTSANYLTTTNSDGAPSGVTTSVFPLGNRSSYNANGVTPVQRRVLNREYSMEICRRLPVSECTFTDWAKDGGGTTSLPDSVTYGTGSANRPRFIDQNDMRFPRRLSFLRFDDIYGDGNMALVMSGRCPIGETGVGVWPIPIGVRNATDAQDAGNQINAYTYPHIFGVSQVVPFRSRFDSGSFGNRFSAYGDIGCVRDTNPSVFVNADVVQFEGRLRDNPNLLSGNLPLPSTTNSTGSNDYQPGTGLIYRRFRFSVQIDSNAGRTENISVSLATLPGATASAKPANMNVNANTLTGTSTPITTDNTTVFAPTGLVINDPATYLGGTDGVGADYIPVVYAAGSFTNRICRTLTPSDGCQLLTFAPNQISQDVDVYVVRDSGQEWDDREACENANAAVFRSPTDIGTANVPTRCENFRLRITGVQGASATIDAARQERRGRIRQALGVPNNTNTVTTTFRRRTRDGAGRTCPNPADNIPPGAWSTFELRTDVSPNPRVVTTSTVGGITDDGTQPPDSTTTSSSDDDQSITNPVTYLPCPTAPGGTRSSLPLPSFAMLPVPKSLAASYPFTTSAADYPTCAGPSDPTIDFAGAPNSAPTRCVTDRRPTFGANSLFGSSFNNFTAANSLSAVNNGLVAPPSDPVVAGDANSGSLPMLPGMMTNYPNFSPRSLWYRTTGTGNWLGESNTTDSFNFNTGRALFLYQSAWPALGGTANNPFNPLYPNRLVLPDTPCIDTADGVVDATCERAGIVPAITTLANLNLPANPVYPQDAGTTRPASSFAVCGATGRSQSYQSREAVLNNVAIRNFTDATNNCPTVLGNPRLAIANFSTLLALPTLTPGTPVFRAIELGRTAPARGVSTLGGSPSQPYELTLTAQNTYADNRANVYSFERDGLGTVSGTTRTIGGIISDPLQAQGLHQRGITIRLRANCVDASGNSTSCRAPNARKLGPSPVFMLRGSATENLALRGVRILLDGVEPNNVFWVTPRLDADAVVLGSIPSQPLLAPVRVATTGNVNLTAAPTTIDGVALTANDRVLVKDQTTPSQNGIYRFAPPIAPATTGTLVRSPDFANDVDVIPGIAVFVQQGSSQANQVYRLTSNVVLVGTNALTFTRQLNPVRTHTAGNVTISAMPATINGVSPAVGDRILVKDQANSAENGIYLYQGVNNPATRVTGETLTNGMLIVVRDGATFNTLKMTDLATGTVQDFDTVPLVPSVLTGNFIGTMPATGGNTPLATTTLTIEDNVALRGVRFLGYRATNVSANTVAVATTTVNEPITVPVIQFQVPAGTEHTYNVAAMNGSVPSIIINGPNGEWTQRATESVFNVYSVAGNTPSRSYARVNGIGAPGNISGETGGGLHNFVRFMENWSDRPATISGGFIQSGRSIYGTGPFSATAPFTNPVVPTGSSFIEPLFYNAAVGNDRLNDFDNSATTPDTLYRSGTGLSLPYYLPPIRLWGFDVGLLTQVPDRFTERFSRDLPTFNDFFREVEKSDPWVQALLCAAQTDNPATERTGAGALPTRYRVRALAGLRDLQETQCNASGLVLNYR